MLKLRWLLGLWLALATSARAQDSSAAHDEVPEDLGEPVTDSEERPRAAPAFAAPRGTLLPGSVKLEALSVERFRELSPTVRPELRAGTRPPSSAPPAAAAEPSRNKIALGLVNGQGIAGSEQRLRLIAGRGTVSTSERGEAVVELPERGVAVVASSAAGAAANKSQLKTSEKTPLPWVVLDEDPGGRSAGGEVRATRPFLQLAEAIRWDPARRVHVAEFWFGLDVERGSPGPLASSLYVLFAATCGEIDPSDKVKLAASGIAGYEKVRVSCSPSDKNARERQQLSLHLDQARLDYPFDIPRLAGAPTLTASAASPDGLGFSTLELTVANHEQDGTLLPAREDLTVMLTTEAGELDLNQIVLPKGAASVVARVHPRGLGALRVAALVAGMQSQPVEVRLSFPTLAATAVVFGGAVGGVLAARRKGRMRRRAIVGRMLEGALVGLVVTALSLLLPDISTLRALRASEVALFALAAVAGFVGTHLIELLAPMLFPALRTPPSPPSDGDEPSPGRASRS